MVLLLSTAGPREEDLVVPARSDAGSREAERVVPILSAGGPRDADRVVPACGWTGRPMGPGCSSGERDTGVGRGSGGRPIVTVGNAGE